MNNTEGSASLEQSDTRARWARLSASDKELLQSYTIDSRPFSKSILYMNSNSCGDNDLPDIYKFDKEKFTDAIRLKSIILRYKNIPDYKNSKIKKIWYLNPPKTSRTGGYTRKFSNSMCSGPMKTVDQYEEGDVYILSSFQSTFTNSKSIKYGSAFKGDDCCITELNLKDRHIPAIYIPEVLEKEEIYPWQEELLLPYGLSIKITNANPEHKETFVDSIYIEGGITLSQLDEQKLLTTDITTRKTVGEINGFFCNLFNHTFDMYEEAIKRYYPHKCAHDSVHAMSTFVLCLILLNLYSNKIGVEQLSCEDIMILQFVTIFHDSGRHNEEKCVDGKDTDETVTRSANNAKNFINEKLRNVKMADRVYNIILHEIQSEPLNDVDQLLYIIYKGADSIDIGRVAVYQPNLNPFYMRFSSLRSDIERISNEWLGFYRSNILNKLDTYIDLPNYDTYDSENISTIIVTLHEELISEFGKDQYEFSYINGITDICRTDLIDEELLKDSVEFIIREYMDKKDVNEQVDKIKIYATVRKIFSEIYDKYENPKGIDELLYEQDDEDVNLLTYVNYINSRKETNIKKWADNGDDIYERIYPLFIYKYRNQIEQLVKIENVYFKNLDRIAILLHIFEPFKKDLTLSKFIIMLDFFSNWMPSFKCYYSEIRFPYGIKESDF